MTAQVPEAETQHSQRPITGSRSSPPHSRFHRPCELAFSIVPRVHGGWDEKQIKGHIPGTVAPSPLLTMSEHLLQWVPSQVTPERSRIGWGVVVAVLVVTFLSKATRKSPNYPPGPPRDPILGNARQMTGDHIERRFAEWGKRYGRLPFILSWD